MITKRRGLCRRETGGGPIRLLIYLLQLVFMLAAFILGIAFILGLIGANPDGEIASWFYERANWLLAPFESFFPQIRPTRVSTIHLSLMFGVFVYVIIAALLEFVGRALARPRRA